MWTFAWTQLQGAYIGRVSEAKSFKVLGSEDMVCDFRELKWAAKDAEKGGLDRSVLNEKLPCATTAERIAEYLHKETSKHIPDDIDLKVIVWETDDCWVEYTDEE